MPNNIFARRVPVVPDVGRKMRVLIDLDAANEVDDQHAMTLAILCPDRFEIEGFVATHFGDSGGPGGTDASYEEILTVLEKAGMSGKFVVKKGGDPLAYSSVAPPSEGVDFMIERAMAGSEEDPLWIIGLGACSNIASAYIKEPAIADRVVVLWHGRTQFWPDRAWNFNLFNDVRAGRVLFSSKLPFVLFDTGTEIYLPMDRSDKTIRPCGALGQYLHEIRYRKPHWQSPTKGLFDLGDIAWLLDPSIGEVEETDAPDLTWNMNYDFKKTWGKMLRVKSVDARRSIEMLEQKLADAFVRKP